MDETEDHCVGEYKPDSERCILYVFSHNKTYILRKMISHGSRRGNICWKGKSMHGHKEKSRDKKDVEKWTKHMSPREECMNLQCYPLFCSMNIN